MECFWAGLCPAVDESADDNDDEDQGVQVGF